MRRILFALVTLFAIGLTACRKDKNYPDIKTYDQQQIAAYIAANGLTGFQEDTTGHSTGTDTTGIWYKISYQGTGTPVDYTTNVSYVYTLKSFDGKFDVEDTMINHYYGLLGHTAPNGLILAIRNILKYPGSKMRVLIPSHLGYGLHGSGSGSSTVTNGRIAGNQCLDYTIELIANQSQYDDQVIQSYIAANNLTGYVRSPDSLWYKIIKPGTSPLIDLNSSVTLYYSGALLNHTFFDDTYVSTTTVFPDLTLYARGFTEGLLKIGNGGVISMILPSHLGYGTVSSGGTIETIPANACLRFEVTVTAVTN